MRGQARSSIDLGSSKPCGKNRVPENVRFMTPCRPSGGSPPRRGRSGKASEDASGSFFKTPPSRGRAARRAAGGHEAAVFRRPDFFSSIMRATGRDGISNSTTSGFSTKIFPMRLLLRFREFFLRDALSSVLWSKRSRRSSRAIARPPVGSAWRQGPMPCGLRLPQQACAQVTKFSFRPLPQRQRQWR